MTPRDYGLLGQLESARQALEEAGDTGLTSRELMAAGGIDPTEKGGGSKQTFLIQLTAYCGIAESDSGRRFWLNMDVDDGFERRIFATGETVEYRSRDDYNGEYDE